MSRVQSECNVRRGINMGGKVIINRNKINNQIVSKYFHLLRYLVSIVERNECGNSLKDEILKTLRELEDIE